jgi:hypothetical protein
MLTKAVAVVPTSFFCSRRSTDPVARPRMQSDEENLMRVENVKTYIMAIFKLKITKWSACPPGQGRLSYMRSATVFEKRSAKVPQQ